jgi:hypothetical protein
MRSGFSRSPELIPVENIWQFMPANWLSNCVFETYDAIIDAACEAWRELSSNQKNFHGMREWTYVGRSQ